MAGRARSLPTQAVPHKGKVSAHGLSDFGGRGIALGRSVTGHLPSAKGIQPREYGLGPLDRTSPDPYLVLVGWSSEPDPDRSLCPGNCMGLHQFFDTVLP